MGTVPYAALEPHAYGAACSVPQRGAVLVRLLDQNELGAADLNEACQGSGDARVWPEGSFPPLEKNMHALCSHTCNLRRHFNSWANLNFSNPCEHEFMH